MTDEEWRKMMLSKDAEWYKKMLAEDEAWRAKVFKWTIIWMAFSLFILVPIAAYITVKTCDFIRWMFSK